MAAPGDITVTTGGVSVVTDDLLHVATQLDKVESAVLEALAATRTAQLEVSPARLRFVDAPATAFAAEAGLAELLVTLPGLAVEAAELAQGVRIAAEQYDFAEVSAHDAAWTLTALAAWLVSRPAAGANAVVDRMGLPVPVPPELRGLLERAGLAVPPAMAPGTDFAELVAEPRFLAGVRALADDAAARVDLLHALLPLFGVPAAALALSRGMRAPLAPPLPHGGTALPATVAPLPSAPNRAVATGTVTPVLAPVTVRPSGGATATTAPTGVADRLARIPPGAGAQVRVETYRAEDGSEVVEVFVAGTDSKAPVVGGDNPWDWESNAVAAVGDESSDSYRATVAALEEAGVDSGTPVNVTGYSQGARIAALLAASGDYNVNAVLEAGGPSGDVHLPADVAHVALQHDDDFVPALGGYPDDPNVVVVGREALTAPPGDVWDAHAIERYRETGELADASQDDALVRAIGAMDVLPAGAGGTRQDYLARRG
ncbi:hypothetical protein [Desertivibrio insolitus]|uniref:hypothetical protein n=1 Tax=Herbiconiux sp. SYSU D00978 TaxID=2812562 RepID=UPI001A95A4F0|nr:hypothetical protein [Herbiconiux sp. SYSU D00978]